MKRLIPVLLLCGLCLAGLCSCTVAANPLAKAEATLIPGVDQTLHAASASEANASALTATLFYRYLDRDRLAGESRVLSVPKDESGEMAVVKALLEGPSAERIELRRLFGEDVTVSAVSGSGHTLFITLSPSLLTDDIPADWQSRADYREEGPLRRLLTVQSLVCTITENFAYDNVQILISREDAAQGNTRLDRSYFLTGGTGPADPLTRDEALILTPQNTAAILLQAWREKDYETLYAFTSTYMDFDTRPVYQTFQETLESAPPLADYQAGQGSVTEDGIHAVCAVRLTVNRANGTEEIPAYPLRLVRENGIWKASMNTLRQMMLR